MSPGLGRVTAGGVGVSAAAEGLSQEAEGVLGTAGDDVIAAPLVMTSLISADLCEGEGAGAVGLDNMSLSSDLTSGVVGTLA